MVLLYGCFSLSLSLAFFVRGGEFEGRKGGEVVVNSMFYFYTFPRLGAPFFSLFKSFLPTHIDHRTRFRANGRVTGLRGGMCGKCGIKSVSLKADYGARSCHCGRRSNDYQLSLAREFTLMIM